MNTYKIADLILNMNVRGELLRKQSGRYLSQRSESADITIDISEEFLILKQMENNHLTFDECNIYGQEENFIINFWILTVLCCILQL